MVMRPKTITSYVVGVDRFFEFLDERFPEVTSVAQITSQILQDFLFWATTLAPRRLGKGLLAAGTPFRWWKSIVAILTELLSSDDCPLSPDLVIPWGVTRGHRDNNNKPYSTKERDQIVRACHRAIELSRKQAGQTQDRQRVRSDIVRLIPYLILLTLRTGFNPGVVLGLPVGCAKPSRLAGLGWVRGAIKFRNGRAPNHPVHPSPVETVVPLNMRECDLIAEVEALTKSARRMAQVGDRKYLWIVTPLQPGTHKRATFSRPLIDTSYFQYLQDFAEIHDLKADDGTRLALNLKRLRPSFAEGLLRANGGDLLDLKKRLNHTTLRATMRYVDPDQEERKKAFRFAGLAYQSWALGADSLPDRDTLLKELKLSYEEVDRLLSGDHNMGVAKCRNPWNSPVKGVPKGEACSEFLVCLRCPNMVVLREDAHRMFSFYWYIHDKQHRMSKRQWNLSYRWILEVIDDQVAPRLGDKQWIEDMKQKAFENPHPLWVRITDAVA
jgi:hypothetical protein